MAVISDLHILSRKTMAGYVIGWYSRLFSSKQHLSAAMLLGGKVVLLSVFGLCSQYLLTHNLTQEGYGLLIWANAVISMLCFLSLPGVSQSLVSAVSNGFLANYRLAWKEKAKYSSLGALVLLAFAIYYHFTGQRELSFVFAISSVFAIGFWMDLPESFWNGRREFSKIFAFSTGTKFVQLALLFLVLKFTSSVVIVFASQIAFVAISNLFVSLYISTKTKRETALSQEFHDYGKYISLLGILSLTAAQVDKWVVKETAGLNSLAVYAVGQLIYTYFMKVPAGIMANMFQPRLAEMSLKNAAKWLLVRQPIVLISLAAIVGAMAVLLPYIYPLLFSAKYVDSIYYAYWFLACVAVSGPQMLIGTILKSHKLKNELFVSQMIMAASPFLALPFGYLWGADGVVWSRFVSMLLLSLWYLYMLRNLAQNSDVPQERDAIV